MNSMDKIDVRQERPGDQQAIDVVIISAFQGEAEDQLVSGLRDSDAFIPELSLVAEVNGRLVGHVLLTRARVERGGGESREILALGPLSVVPSQSYRGIGTELVAAGLRQSREMGYGAIVVVGKPAFYQKRGFKAAAEWELKNSLPVPESTVSAAELKPGYLDGGGVVKYPAPFEELY